MLFKKRKGFSIHSFMKKAKRYSPFDSESFEELVDYYEATAAKVAPKKMGLRLVVISDTHGDLAFHSRFEKFMENVPEHDMVIILGDIYCYELDHIVKVVPIDKIIALRGNHDRFDVYDKYGIRNVNGKVFTYNGVRFTGIEGSFRYKNEKFPSYTHYESLKLAMSMSAKADVLLSHDEMFRKGKYDRAHLGLAGITYYIFKNCVQWHIHGYIHKSYESAYSNGTREKSVYGCEYFEI